MTRTFQDNLPLDAAHIHRLSEKQARALQALVLGRRVNGPGLLVAVRDPDDVVACDKLADLLQEDLELIRIDAERLRDLLDLHYRRKGDIDTYARLLEKELTQRRGQAEVAEHSQSEIRDSASGNDTPTVTSEAAAVTIEPAVARLVHSILEEATQTRASDVHIESRDGVARIRLRIDGQLEEQSFGSVWSGPALISRIKLLAGMDIAERRLPQDGRFSHRLRDRRLDVRAASMPIAGGEAIVLRLLEQRADLQEFPALGIPDELAGPLTASLRRLNGLVLVSGPTGSGKTTTLYSAIRGLNRPGIKVVSAEDPVEYRLDGVNQVQVESGIGLDFARILRSLLRHDPDVIVVGEIRDPETASIALRAAMTGHLVLSTVHANDALSIPARLMDMGCEGYLVADTVLALLAQRLVRRLCLNCRVASPATARQLHWLKQQAGDIALDRNPFFAPRGCGQCGQTGYRGRVGVYELVMPDSRMRGHLRQGELDAAMQAGCRLPGYRPLGWQALQLAINGVTSLDEVLRLAVDDTAVTSGSMPSLSTPWVGPVTGNQGSTSTNRD